MNWRIRLVETRPVVEEVVEAKTQAEAIAKFYDELDTRLDTSDLVLKIEIE